MDKNRIVSGMRPTGRLHLGHYHGCLKNWIELQHKYESFFFIADWHALTTHYEDPSNIETAVWETLIDWLAVGINPSISTIFLQSKVPEHAELHLLLSMITPLSWLERVPTYKEQKEKLKSLDLSTYGFLGYPLLQSADILAYRAHYVPVGEDQNAHVELTRELARHFNHIYGQDPDFINKAEQAIPLLGKKGAKLYRQLRKQFQEQGDVEAVTTAQVIVNDSANLSVGDKERLLGYLEGMAKLILPEPEALLTKDAKLPGLDGQKMSKSYNNTIGLRDSAELVDKKIAKMQTDPARKRRTDPGEPSKCPVWSLHRVYSDDATQEWVVSGCRSAGIGCLECKKPIAEAIKQELQPIQEKIVEYEAQPELVQDIINQGSERARDEARATLKLVRSEMGL